MITHNEIMKYVKALSLTEQLQIAEDILRSIRESDATKGKHIKVEETEHSGPAILAMAGILDEEEAKVFESAVAESRKIDR